MSHNRTSLRKVTRVLSLIVPCLTITSALAGDDDQTAASPRKNACELLSGAYLKAALYRPDLPRDGDQIHRDLVGLAATVARHAQLDRILTMAWAQQCDLGPFITAESRAIDKIYTGEPK